MSRYVYLLRTYTFLSLTYDYHCPASLQLKIDIILTKIIYLLECKAKVCTQLHQNNIFVYISSRSRRVSPLFHKNAHRDHYFQFISFRMVFYYCLALLSVPYAFLIPIKILRQTLVINNPFPRIYRNINKIAYLFF